jgi:hypothetical protein
MDGIVNIFGPTPHVLGSRDITVLDDAHIMDRSYSVVSRRDLEERRGGGSKHRITERAFRGCVRKGSLEDPVQRCRKCAAAAADMQHPTISHAGNCSPPHLRQGQSQASNPQPFFLHADTWLFSSIRQHEQQCSQASIFCFWREQKSTMSSLAISRFASPVDGSGGFLISCPCDRASYPSPGSNPWPRRRIC